MESSYEQLDPTQVKLTVEVPFEEFKPEIDKAAKTIGNQVQIPGFRRVHVPARVLEAQIGRAAIVEQAINDSLDGYYQDVLEEHDLVPMGRPAVDVTGVAMEKNSTEPLAFTVTVDVRPAIVIPDPAQYSFEVEATNADADAVDERLEQLRERFATLKTVERAAASRDYVTINLSASIDGEEVDSVEGVSYRIGDDNMLDGLDEAVNGASAGDELSFTSTLVCGEHAGEQADVTVVVEKVQESELPEADDDFAQLASEFDTIEELRADLAEKAATDAAQVQVMAARNLLLDKLREDVTVQLPKRVIDAEVERHLESENRATDDDHAKEIRGEIRDSLRDQIILDELVKKFGVETTQDELFNFLVQQAQSYGMDPNQFISAAAQTGQLGAFSGELRRGKALISALRLAKVVDTNGNEVDVIKVVGEKPEGELTPDFSAAPSRPVWDGPVDEDGAADSAPVQGDDAAAAPAAEAAAAAEEAPAADSGADAPAADADAFDPAAKKVDEVVEYAQGADAAEVARVLEAEKAGKARKTLVKKLEELLG